MPLDTRIPLSIQQPQFESPLNILARVQQVKAQQQAMQANALAIQRSQQQYEQQQRLNALVNDPNTTYEQRRDALIGAGQYRAAGEMRGAKESAEKTAAHWVENVPKMLANVPREKRADAYTAMLQHGAATGLDISLIPPQLTPEFDAIIEAAGKPTQYQQQTLNQRGAHNSAMESAANRRATAAENKPPPAPAQTLDDRLALKGLRRNPDGTQTFIPGGPADPDVMRRNQSVKLSEGDKANREKHYPKATAAMTASTRDLDTLIAKVDELAAHPGLPNITGTLAGRTPNVANEATDAQAVLDSIRAAGALAKITELRQNSPTGGALGNVSDRDIGLLKDAAATLAQSQGTPAFKRHLADYRALLERTKQDITEAYALDYEYRQGGGSAAPGGSAKEDPLGIR